MSTASRSIRALSAGAALVTCSLASASITPLNFSTVDSATGILNLGSTTGTFSYTGPANSMQVYLSVGAGSGAGAAAASGYNVIPGIHMDLFVAGLNTTSTSYTAGVFSVTFVLTLNQAAYFSDMSAYTSSVANWQMDSVAVTNGQLIGIGQHVFTGTLIYSGAPTQTIGSMFGLYNPAAAVPLPGAAGLAAVGLAGLSRRRRR